MSECNLTWPRGGSSANEGDIRSSVMRGAEGRIGDERLLESARHGVDAGRFQRLLEGESG